VDSVRFEVDKVSTLNLPGIAVSDYEVEWDSDLLAGALGRRLL
jgi:hypothetical protein